MDSQRIQLTDEDLKLARVIPELLRKVPLGELGFPLGIYRCDMLPWHDYNPEENNVALLLASVPTEPKEVIHAPVPEYGQGQEVEDADEETEGSPVLDTEDVIDAFDVLDEEYEAGIEDLDALIEHPQPNESPAVDAPLPVSDRIAGFRRQDLVPAFVPLSFDEGFPTLPDGRPIWEQLEWESPEAYLAFQSYLAMPDVTLGVRSLGELPDVMEANKFIKYNGVGPQDFTAKFRNHYIVYFWSLRTKAYDLFKMAAFRKQQEFRAMSVQEDHFNVATKLKHRLMEYLESEEEFWDMMSPKVGIEMFKMLTAHERLSVGLPANAPLVDKANVGQGGQSLEMILRTLTQQHKPVEGALIEGSEDGGVEKSQRLTSQILANPETTRMAQELIIRIYSSGAGKR